jgi:hypothetical protein
VRVAVIDKSVSRRYELCASRGINYDTGFISAGTTTREPFDPRVVKREMQIIHDDLHCDTVRVTGGYPERLEIAAAQRSSPFTNE